MVLVGFNWAQLSEKLGLVEMRILAQSLQLVGSAMDQMRQRRQDCFSPPRISGRSRRQGRAIARPIGKPLTPALRPDAPASGNPALEPRSEAACHERIQQLRMYRSDPGLASLPEKSTMFRMHRLNASGKPSSVPDNR